MAEIVGDPSTVQSATVTVSDFWLKDPVDSTRNIIIEINGSSIDIQSAEEQGVFEPIGRTTPIIVGDVVRSDVLDLPLYFRTKADYDKFVTLRNSQRVLLLQSDTTEQWYVRPGREVKTSILNVVGQHRSVTVRLHETVAP